MRDRPPIDTALTLALLGLVGLAAGMGSGACGPPTLCEEGCDGNTRLACDSSFYGDPTREDCGERRCVADQRQTSSAARAYSACAIGGREARCNADVDDVFCDGEKLTSCRGAFVEAQEDCAARGMFCAVRPSEHAPHAARCVSSRTPDARCAGAPRYLLCDGDFLALCFGELLVRADQPCSAKGQSCVPVGASAVCK
jgi:hypothetical protein